MRRNYWLWAFISILGISVVLTACQTEEPAPLPTLADPTLIAATVGVLPPEAIDATLTARVPTTAPSPTETIVPTDTLFPSDTSLPSVTFTDEPSATVSPTPSITPVFDNPKPNRIIFSSDLEKSADIWVMNADGKNPHPVYFEFSSTESTPTCDPQGRSLIFVSDKEGDREIYFLDYVASTPRPLTDTNGENFSPVWSPEGDKVAFVSTRNGNADIFVMDNGGGNVQQLTSSAADELYPSWSPDGQTVWYSANQDGNFDIYRYSFATNTNAPFTLTPRQNETQPTISLDGKTMAFVDETTFGDLNSQAVYIADVATGERTLIAAGDRPIVQPVWQDFATLLVTADLGEDGVGILQVNLSNNEITVLTPLNAIHREAQSCFMPEAVVANLPDIPTTTPAPSDTPPPSETPLPSLTPSRTPRPIPTQAPVVNGSAFVPVTESGEDWFISSETWVSLEMAAIAPAVPGSAPLQAFLVDNLLNLVWNDAAGRHVLSMAIEPLQGALEVTLIGYTVNDFPGDLTLLEDYDIRMREQILLNSIRFGEYHLASVEITAVNITFVFEVPILPVQPPFSQYRPTNNAASTNWLISTERWTPFELARLFSVSVESPAGVDFVDGNIHYTWADENNAHILLVQFLERDGDFSVIPISYAVNGNPANADTANDFLFIIREGILLHSLPPGQFRLSRISFSDATMEMNFLIPPDFSGTP